MTPQFWRGRRVFITGHTGFKGSWLSLWLRRFGAEVTGFALAAPTQPSLFEVARVGEDLRSIVADIRDAQKLREALAESAPEIVFHMAAQSLVRQSYANPIETYATNVMGTVHLLEAVRHVPSVRAVVIVTSDKCYENREWLWGYREVDAMGGFDPYSSSKGCAELVTSAFRNSYFPPDKYATHGVAIASARAGNVIGGGDWASGRLIPDILAAAAEGVPVSIRSPHAIRPWQHVLEPLAGYLMLAERLCADGAKYAEAWNFGPGEDGVRTVQWIAETLAPLLGDGIVWEIDQVPGPHEATYLKLDASKARAALGWQPSWSTQEALERIAAWHKAWLAHEDMRSICLDDMKRYEAAA